MGRNGKRELTNAVLYLVDSGCKRRQLPHDFPPYSTVRSFYRRARLSGLREKIRGHLVILTRKKAGRKETPTYGFVDFQSVRTTCPGEERGIDGEKTKGRKRHLVTDVMGNILTVTDIHDTVSGVGAAKAAQGKYPCIKGFCGDMGYKGTFVTEIGKIPGVHADISEKIKPHAWEKLRWRRVAERTFGRLNHSRRPSKDYEITTDSAVAMVIISHCHTLLKRL